MNRSSRKGGGEQEGRGGKSLANGRKQESGMGKGREVNRGGARKGLRSANRNRFVQDNKIFGYFKASEMFS